jgi:hypothetical protein
MSFPQMAVEASCESFFVFEEDGSFINEFQTLVQLA